MCCINVTRAEKKSFRKADARIDGVNFLKHRKRMAEGLAEGCAPAKGTLGANYKKILRLSYDVIITYDNRKSNLR